MGSDRKSHRIQCTFSRVQPYADNTHEYTKFGEDRLNKRIHGRGTAGKRRTDKFRSI